MTAMTSASRSRGPNYEKRRAHRQQAFERARFLSEMLRRTLGGECAVCGESDMTLLTIDHVDGVTYDRYALRYDARIQRYIAEFCAGVRLRVLCLVCNGRFGRLEQLGVDVGTNDVTDQERADAWLEQHPKELPDAPF